MAQVPTGFSQNLQTLTVLRQANLARFDFFMSSTLHYKVMPFHARIIEHMERTRYSLVLGPRGSGKSITGDVAYCLHQMVKNPNIRICIASKSGPQAKGFLQEIKAHIEGNEDFIKLFGNLKGTTWNEDEILISTRTKILKEPTITALGAGAGIPGRHFDLIIGDDLVDEENSATEHQREKNKKWFYTTLMPTLEPEGELRLLGTRYHVHDLYGHFAYKDKYTGEWNDPRIGPNVLCIPALTTVTELNEDGEETIISETSFWPEKFTVKYLKELRRSMGSLIFKLQMQNDATISEGGIINLDDLENNVWTSDKDRPPLNELMMFMGVDPAIGEKQANDFFCLVVIGVHTVTNHIYVLEVFKQKISYNEQVDVIIRKYAHWNVEKVGIETIAYQKALAQGVRDKGAWMNVHEVKPRIDKTARAKIFSAYTERQEVHCHMSMISLMETCAGMPHVEHDDEFDGLDIAVEAAKQVLLLGSVVQIMGNNFRRKA